MNYNIYPPSDELKNIVKYYVVFNSLQNMEKLLFLPNGGSFILFNRGIDVNAKLVGLDKIYHITAKYSASFKTNRIIQIFLDSGYTDNDEFFPIIVVELLPIGFYKLFHKDMSSMEFQYQEIEKEIVDKYFSKVYTNGNTDDELNSLDKFLIELNNSHNNSYLQIENVLDKIYNDYNLEVNIEDLLEKFKYSRSTLERHFKKMIGLTPKQFIYISKFCKTLLEYIDEKRTFHELQYIYSDNSHMNAVFQNFLGIAPSEIFKKVVDGEFAIYQLLNLHKEKLTQLKGSEVIDIKEILKYSKKYKVLYVEDDIVIRDVMRKLLENYFDKVDVADDGQLGLNKYLNMHDENKIYDLVITDINMPNMNGVEMCRTILKLIPSQKIMIISAHCEYITTVKELGINYIMSKPVNYNELSQNIYNVSKEIHSAR